MEQDEITRRNVAIAEYMGAEEMWVRKDFEDPHHRDMPGQLLEKVKQVPYHEDWKLLMPAVEKITKESNLGFHFFPPFGRYTFVCRFGTERNYVGDTMIEATWLAVSEYVLALK